MIKVQKTAEPLILTTNKLQWTADLKQAIARVGGYAKLKKADKEKYLYHYKHDDIHAALKNGAMAERCVYCECDIKGGDPNVEHYHPKSIYVDETFLWDNLFSSCVRCNRPKGSFDTKNEPFIHPVNEDPEEFLTYNHLTICCRYGTGVNHQKAKNVIEKCDLCRDELIPSLSDRLLLITKYTQQLKPIIDKYYGYSQNKKKLEVANDLLSKLRGIKQLSLPSHEHTGFTRECIRRNVYVEQALAIVNNHAPLLGIGSSFQWGWNYNLPHHF